MRREGPGSVDPQPVRLRQVPMRHGPQGVAAAEAPDPCHTGRPLRILRAVGLHQLVDPRRGHEWHTEEIGQDLGFPGHIGEVVIVGHEHARLVRVVKDQIQLVTKKLDGRRVGARRRGAKPACVNHLHGNDLR